MSSRQPRNHSPCQSRLSEETRPRWSGASRHGRRREPKASEADRIAMSSGRGRFWPFSLWIRITALIVSVGFDPIYARSLETGSEELRHCASSAFDAIYFVILPLAYFTGITFG